MQQILFSTVCRPFGGAGEGDSVGAELFHAQVTRAQGAFSLRQVIRGWSIDYIAENLCTPSVVLHYPSEKEFVRELKKGKFSYVGITFVVSTFHKAKRMSTLVRRHAPGVPIIYGGYGTVLPDEELRPWCDHICREEGITYMRRLLGEEETGTVRHPYVPINSPRILSYGYPGKIAHVTGGLGCPNGCDFCCTSHYFKRRYLPFAKTGKELHQAIVSMEQRAAKAGDTLSGFIIIDEDFFLQESRAREFLEYVRQGGEDRSIMGFGSIRGLSKFSADEIAEMGFDTIWTAVEAEQAGYSKLSGTPIEELYKNLKSTGVAILSSMIIGFPYQDRAQIMKEFDRLIKLGPSLSQILIYFAFPGTPFYEKVIAEGRYLPQYSKNPDYRRYDGFSMHMKHDHFTHKELEDLQKELYRREYELLGPSIVRIARQWFDSSRYLMDSSRPILQKRGRRKAETVRGFLPAIYAASKMGPNKDRKDEARQLVDDICRVQGPLSVKERLMNSAGLALAAWTELCMQWGIFQQPELLRCEYGAARGASPCRAHGGIMDEAAILTPVPGSAPLR